MMNLDIFLSLAVIPLLNIVIDSITRFRGRFGSTSWFAVTDSTAGCQDYTVIVPIYGSIHYLENVDYLRQYGDRVLLTTSGDESPDFYDELHEIASENGFRVHVSARLPSPAERTASPGKARATGGTLRDTIVLDAHRSITSSYVVCIDADTVTDASLDLLIGAMKAADYDVASVVLTPSNQGTLLARLQGHEYRMAMRVRRVIPWLVSGGCHVARREVHRLLMQKHSHFFQGNDVELGMLAKLLRYRVGHIPFVVPTKVPDGYLPWFRQRKAWAGGEFRLMIVNWRLALRHPFIYIYGAVLVIALVPLRWESLFHPGLSLGIVLFLYLLVVTTANWRSRDLALFAYPLYALCYSLILVPIGVFSYVEMAITYHNWGVISSRRGNHQARYAQARLRSWLGDAFKPLRRSRPRYTSSAG